LFRPVGDDLRKVKIADEVFYFSLSFDIGRYDSGIFWLQLYDDQKRLVFDEPFAAPWDIITVNLILRIIKKELAFIEWPK
jgi:hypothetical protein